MLAVSAWLFGGFSLAPEGTEPGVSTRSGPAVSGRAVPFQDTDDCV